MPIHSGQLLLAAQSLGWPRTLAGAPCVPSTTLRPPCLLLLRAWPRLFRHQPQQSRSIRPLWRLQFKLHLLRLQFKLHLLQLHPKLHIQEFLRHLSSLEPHACQAWRTCHLRMRAFLFRLSASSNVRHHSRMASGVTPFTAQASLQLVVPQRRQIISVPLFISTFATPRSAIPSLAIATSASLSVASSVSFASLDLPLSLQQPFVLPSGVTPVPAKTVNQILATLRVNGFMACGLSHSGPTIYALQRNFSCDCGSFVEVSLVKETCPLSLQ